jgi:hypothetical protein
MLSPLPQLTTHVSASVWIGTKARKNTEHFKTAKSRHRPLRSCEARATPRRQVGDGPWLRQRHGLCLYHCSAHRPRKPRAKPAARRRLRTTCAATLATPAEIASVGTGTKRAARNALYGADSRTAPVSRCSPLTARWKPPAGMVLVGFGDFFAAFASGPATGPFATSYGPDEPPATTVHRRQG